MNRSRLSAFAVAAGLAAALGATGQIRPPAPPPAPETAEIQAAERIADPAGRLRELLRIKTAYPGSAQAGRIDGDILETRIDLAPTVQAVIDLQKGPLGQSRGPDLLSGFARAAARILDHAGLAGFDRGQVLAAVVRYKVMAERAAAEPGTFAATVDPGERAALASAALRDFDLLIGRAMANAGEGAKAVASLQTYRAGGGEAGPDYFCALGDAYTALGRAEEAYGLYLGAAVERYPGAGDKARAAYLKLHGTAAGFEDRLEALFAALPFQPEPFAAPKRWRGKTVLAEVFTNADNPLCLASDLAVGGLIQTYPARYLAILCYHVPAPRPDPLTNEAAHKRQEQYRSAGGVPAVIIDGEMRIAGGGTRRMAEGLFKRYKAAIDSRISGEPGLKLTAEAKWTGDRIEVETGHDHDFPQAAHTVALVQERESLKGGSGVVVHKLVVRGLVDVDPAGNGKAAFKPSGIARGGLQVVYFVQDKASRRILNSVVADVK